MKRTYRKAGTHKRHYHKAIEPPYFIGLMFQKVNFI